MGGEKLSPKTVKEFIRCHNLMTELKEPICLLLIQNKMVKMGGKVDSEMWDIAAEMLDDVREICLEIVEE